MNKARIGHGYDVHAFGPGDGFVLGGVAVPADRTIVAHSDGDVLIHALCDALLGAIGQGDIGRLFADDDPQNKNRESQINIKATTTEKLGFIGREQGIAVAAVVLVEKC